MRTRRRRVDLLAIGIAIAIAAITVGDRPSPIAHRMT